MSVVEPSQRQPQQLDWIQARQLAHAIEDVRAHFDAARRALDTHSGGVVAQIVELKRLAVELGRLESQRSGRETRSVADEILVDARRRVSEVAQQVEALVWSAVM